MKLYQSSPAAGAGGVDITRSGAAFLGQPFDAPWAMVLVNQMIKLLTKENGEIHTLWDGLLAAESRLDP